MRAYLERAGDIPHRAEGESALLAEIPPTSRRVLDLGSGDGRLLALVLSRCPKASGFADVDCLWKWRELALLYGRVPS